ncbi:receptor-type adenlyate cyclase, partial [Trypanosoma grayi]|uniref:receptor-type adenlyate cyclase n=1 Tax=Trypanosoma grayi TaxID=71804 RepID=UPI0004F43921
MGRRALRPGGLDCCLHVCVGLVVSVLLVAAPRGAVGQDGGGNRTVKLLVFDATDTLMTPHIRLAAGAGFEAALWVHNFTAPGGTKINITRKLVELDKIRGEVVNDLNTDPEILLLLGPKEEQPLLRALPALGPQNCVSFAPIAGSSEVRGWNPNLFFLRPEPFAELVALIRYAVTRLRVLRLGFMYLQGVLYGEIEYFFAEEELYYLGYTFSGVFTLKSSFNASAADDVFNAEWERFAETRPQAVIVVAPQLNDTIKFIQKMLKDPRTSRAFLLGPFAVQDTLLTTWQEAEKNGVKYMPGQLVTAGAHPPANNGQYLAVKRFQKEMKDFLTNRVPKLYEDNEHFLKNDNDGEMMIAGWIVGNVLFQTLSNPELLKSRKSYTESLFNQRRFVVDDLVFGDFGGECAGIAASQGAMCKCNQGGRTVFIKHFVENFRMEELTVARLVTPLQKCYVSQLRLMPPFNGVVIRITDDPSVVPILQKMAVGFYAAVGADADRADISDLTFQFIATTTTGARTALLAEMQQKNIHGVAGITTDDILDTPNLVFIDVVHLKPRLNKRRRHDIRLSPTLEQEFFVLAQYLANTTVANAHAVIRSDEAAAMQDVLRRSLVTFGGSLKSSALLGGGDALGDYLPRKGVVFVVGLAAADVALIAGHLAKHSGARVFVLFTEFSLLYGEFVAAFNGSAAAERLV